MRPPPPPLPQGVFETFRILTSNVSSMMEIKVESHEGNLRRDECFTLLIEKSAKKVIRCCFTVTVVRGVLRE